MYHGFTIDLLVELVRSGLATAQAERVVAGGRAMEIARVRITDAGRQAWVEQHEGCGHMLPLLRMAR